MKKKLIILSVLLLMLFAFTMIASADAAFTATGYVIAGNDFELSFTEPGYYYAFDCGDGAGYRVTGDLYGSSQSKEFFQIDPSSGVAAFVANMPSYTATEIEYDNIAQLMYVEQKNGGNLLFTIDITTGAETSSATHMAGGLVGLEFVGTTLYGTFIQGPGDPSDLVIVDTATGNLNFVGPTGFGPVSGLAYDAVAGVMYGITAGPSTSDLVVIDLATGAATLIGPTGFDHIGSIEFGPGGVLYGGLAQNATSSANHMVRIDPATGIAILVGDSGYSISGLTFMADDAATCSTSSDELGTRTVKGIVGNADGSVTEFSTTVTVLPPSAATNSSLCYYDRQPDFPGQQFRLIFTPDMQMWPAYKLPASNPGQFFYNVFYTGTDPVDFDISIPDPFVTKGVNPVHVYTDVSVVENDGFKCFEPVTGSEIYAGDLAGLNGLSDPGGFLYVAVHLDYSLKGSTGYLPNFNKDALDASDGVTVLIPNLGDYIFSVSGSQNDSRTIQNFNDFKKIPGFGGLVMDGYNPVEGATVEIYLGEKFLGTATTDEDGWYLFVYKHKGKRVQYTLELEGYEPKTGVLKANKFAEVNFP